MMDAARPGILENTRRHPTPRALADALAQQVAQALAQAVRLRARASLVVSGGRTPIPFLDALAAHELPWPSIDVTLADERWVPVASAHSNERLIRTHLLRGPAAGARFVGLHNAAPDPASGESACAEAIAALPRPFDVVVLGMGSDGHTASLFPGAPELADALATERPCAAVTADQAPYARMTLTPAALLDSRGIFLHITGEAKWAVLEAAVTAGPVGQYPMRVVLHQDRVPVHVHWSP